MTEAQGLTSTSPGSMLDSLRGKGQNRKLRLFICACCRRIWHLLADPRSRNAVEVAERMADGLAGEAERRQTANTARAACSLEGGAADAARFAVDDHLPDGPDHLIGQALEAIPSAATAMRKEYLNRIAPSVKWGPDMSVAEIRSWLDREDVAAVWQAEQTFQAHLLRDIFGNPFRAVSLDRSWLTSTVTDLARAAYEERLLPTGHLDPIRLSVLADALEENGCPDGDILAHLRGAGPHVRGCFAVDALLGKA